MQNCMRSLFLCPIKSKDMKADFHDALARHWDDAERLFGAQRWANADHLYGMAAECGLKALMRKFGMPYGGNGDRPDERVDRVHADGIWTRFESYRSGHDRGAGYELPAGNPFQDWRAEQRYAHQAGFDQYRAQAHQMATRHVRSLIQRAQREGLIP